MKRAAATGVLGFFLVVGFSLPFCSAQAKQKIVIFGDNHYVPYSYEEGEGAGNLHPRP